jgi:hypothetical protein
MSIKLWNSSPLVLQVSTFCICSIFRADAPSLAPRSPPMIAALVSVSPPLIKMSESASWYEMPW